MRASQISARSTHTCGLAVAGDVRNVRAVQLTPLNARWGGAGIDVHGRLTPYLSDHLTLHRLDVNYAQAVG